MKFHITLEIDVEDIVRRSPTADGLTATTRIVYSDGRELFVRTADIVKMEMVGK